MNRDNYLFEATETDPPDVEDVALKMIEENEKLREMLNSSYDHIMLPAFAKAQGKLKDYKTKVGISSRVAPGLVAQIIVPALRQYAEHVRRVAENTEKKFKSHE